LFYFDRKLCKKNIYIIYIFKDVNTFLKSEYCSIKKSFSLIIISYSYAYHCRQTQRLAQMKKSMVLYFRCIWSRFHAIYRRLHRQNNNLFSRPSPTYYNCIYPYPYIEGTVFSRLCDVVITYIYIYIRLYWGHVKVR